jgi:hypothetical protein
MDKHGHVSFLRIYDFSIQLRRAAWL